MASARMYQAAMSAGVLGRELEARADLDAYALGVRTMRNLLPRRAGGAQSRPGSRFVEQVPDGYLMRTRGFDFNAEQTYTVGFCAHETGASAGMIRFYRDGGVLLDPASGPPLTPYTIASDYTAAELATLSFVQSADVLFIFCPTKPVRELRRLADDGSSVSWSLVDAAFADGPYDAVNTGATTLVVTSGTPAAGATGIEITASAALFASTDVGRQIRIRANANTGDWAWATITAFTSDTVVEVTVGPDTAFDASLHGGGAVPSTNWRLGAFSATTGYPRCGAFAEGRLLLGATASLPQSVFASVAGDISGFAPSQPDGTVADDSGFVLTLDDDRVNRIEWILPAAGAVLIGTSGGEFVLEARSSAGDPITPTNAEAFRQTAYGSAANVNAVKAGQAALFVQRGSGVGRSGMGSGGGGGRQLREMIFRFAEDQYAADDQTLRCGELLHAAPIDLAADLAGSAGIGASGSGGVVELAMATTPAARLWALRADGVLLAFDYEPTQNTRAWSDHVLAGSCPDELGRQPGIASEGRWVPPAAVDLAEYSGGRVESIAVIRDDASAQDQLWLVVKREINGSTVRFVEYLLPEPELGWRQEDGVHLDASLGISGWRTDGATLSVVVDSAGAATATASASAFDAGDVGKVLGLQTDRDATGYRSDASNAGRDAGDVGVTSMVTIAGYSSGTVVTLASGHGLDEGTHTFRRWGFALAAITGLDHLAGQSVSVVADGGLDSVQTVPASGASAGELTLENPAMVVVAGLAPLAVLRLMPIVASDANSSSLTRRVNLSAVQLRLLRSVAVKLAARCEGDGRAVDLGFGSATVPRRDPFTGSQTAQPTVSGCFREEVSLEASFDVWLELWPSAPLTMRLLATGAEVTVSG